jgi:hypothetical protein
MNVEHFTLDDLPQLDGAVVERQNQLVALLSPRVYQIMGQELVFKSSAPMVMDKAVYVGLLFAGQPFVIAVSENFANLLLKDEGVMLSQVNKDVLTLLIRVKLLSSLPKDIQLKGLALEQAQLDSEFSALPAQLSLQAHIASSGEPADLMITLHSYNNASQVDFLASFDAWVARQIPSALLNVPVDLPMVAAKTSIPADQVQTLAVGDVILFN